MKSSLAAFRIERRRISVAVFVHDGLDYTGSRELPSLYPKALESASRYVEWIRKSFSLEGAALEKTQSDPKESRSKFTKEIIKQLRDNGVPVFEVGTNVLLASFAHPPLRHRTQLREVISSLWPILATKEKASCLDAAALGLYVQIEKMLRASNQ